MPPFKHGDLVLIWEPRKNKKLVFRLEKNKKIHTQWGVINPEDIINKNPGDIIKTHLGKKLYLFRPKLYELIEHSKFFAYATQIVRPRDWGLIISYTDIGPGSIVVEIGTGSGAFTAFLSKIVAPNGKVISYERIAERAELAKKNLEALSVPKVYEIRVEDPSQTGIHEKNVDAIFIDIPEPWTVLKYAYESLKPGGDLICYIPTFNQVKVTLETATKIGFAEIRIIDHFFREIQANPNAIRPLLKSYVFSAFILFARKITKSIP